MAYINSEKTAAIRNELKKQFPAKDGWKFSVRNENHSSVNIAILQAPVKFVDKDYAQLNEYYLERYENSDILKKISSIADGNFFDNPKERNYNNSDSMTDYFDRGWYTHLEVGKWNTPFVQIANNQ